MIYSAILGISMLLAQVDQGPMMGPSGPSAERVAVVAIQASQTGEASMDPALNRLEQALADLPYDTFEELLSGEQPVHSGYATAFPISETYGLTVAITQRDENAVGIVVQVQTEQHGQPVNAVLAQGLVPRGQPLLFRGLEHGDGELVLLLTVRPPDQQQGEQESGPESEADDDADEQREDEQQDQMEMERPEPHDAQDQPQPQDLSEDDMQNVEAILQSLLEQDRREQEEMHNRRSRVTIRGPWW